ncbi:MAG: NUDIX domain-containing protein [Nanoarchaeota archaeon]|nr:NUDIX domain-containing protein [Nanoarchaeota archaeon]MBU0977404.1 NUDIX domain-containing protein [Nanoarchaeota archaeon]
MGDINWKDKCWVTTIYLVNSERKVLLTWNKVLQTWIPVGGHIDVGETPEEAVVREVAEETGFDFEFVSPHEKGDYGNVKLMKNHLVQIEDVPHHNKHMNFIFYGRCLSYDEKAETDENEKLRWFSGEELVKEKESFLPNVWDKAVEAIQKVK